MGDKYNLFMVEEPNSEGPDLRGGPCVSLVCCVKRFQNLVWQYVIALLLFVLTIGSSVEQGIASQQINRLPPEVVKYFTDPNAIEPPDMQLLFPFVESALPLAYGVLGVQLFHFKSILLDLKTKVDISLAVPFAGATLSFSMFVVGLLLSSNLNAVGDLVQVPSMLFQGSLLLGLISRAPLDFANVSLWSNAYSHSLDPSSCNFRLIANHSSPRCRCGLTMSAFNMNPVGCLDGGRAIQIRNNHYKDSKR
ncbi:hypothetical protein HYC85_025481 [Camellia sinensis]|uniref:Uncharacterized protein n=1 Tax=Camellia sinensis TaxID=4442 RepID=A0A7J7GCF6_CAMSI|nr:hypothetical protein HYC85_025481 [Camellia sinensis]